LALWLALSLAVWVAVYLVLAPCAEWLTYRVLHLDRTGHLGRAVEFFLFEAPKVLMLLTLVVFGVGIVRSFVTPERTRRILSGRREFAGSILAALLGVVTPFCSCSAVPVFIGFVTAGVPLGDQTWKKPTRLNSPEVSVTVRVQPPGTTTPALPAPTIGIFPDLACIGIMAAVLIIAVAAIIARQRKK
jgi:hypothetical protein